ncbi:uncharacterized protein [Littorina saxatilis]|uniref:RRM domain-containing protein n=1 Tax=Littorina saxatilis TaxID=31220 RepID=A0AAN9BZ01_9CAEN
MMRRGPSHAPPSHAHGPPLAGLGQISNVTNSADFASKDSRVFVGNLNTYALSKEDVDNIFRRYGIVSGISMHKGYAFVQFNYPGEARRAVGFENGQVYAGQQLDLNIVSEPKNRPPQKRIAGPPMNDRRPPMQSSPGMPPLAKRPRQDSNPSLQRSNLVTLANSGPKNPVINRPRPQARPMLNSSANRAAAAVVKRAAATVTRSTTNAARPSTSATALAPSTDVLICGVCKLQFTSLHSLAQHKKIPCRLRMSCQCQTNPPKQQEDKDPVELECASCDARFSSAWSLCQHCQDEHDISIFKTKDSASKTTNKATPAAKPAATKVDNKTEDKNGKEGGEETDAKEGEAKKITTPAKK